MGIIQSSFIETFILDIPFRVASRYIKLNATVIADDFSIWVMINLGWQLVESYYIILKMILPQIFQYLRKGMWYDPRAKERIPQDAAEALH